MENTAVLNEYTQLADKYDARWHTYTVNSIAATLKRVEVRPTDHILDVGCGTGALLAQIKANRVGIDPSAAMLTMARHKLPAVPFLRAWSDHIPYPDNYFDIVFTTSNFHYWRNPTAGLHEVKRVLKRGGRLVLTDWCRDYATMKLMHVYLRQSDDAVQQTYTTAEISTLLAIIGFQDVTTTRYKVTPIWGLMTAVAQKA